MTTLEKFILSHKLSCTKRRGGISACNCGRDKAAAELATKDEAIEAARDALRHVQKIRGLRVDRVVYEALAKLEAAK